MDRSELRKNLIRNVLRYFHELPSTCNFPRGVLIELFGAFQELRSSAKAALRKDIWYKVSGSHFTGLSMQGKEHHSSAPEVELLLGMYAIPG